MSESTSAFGIWLIVMVIVSVTSALNWNDEFFIRQPHGEAVLQWSFACDFQDALDIIKVPYTTGREQCGQLCVNNAQCTHITWNSGSCSIKRSTSAVSPRDFSSCVSGWINRLRQDVRPTVDSSVTCFYSGKDIIRTALPTSDQCRDNCINNRRCIHFAWVQTNCYLMFSDSSLTASDLNAVVCGRITNRTN